MVTRISRSCPRAGVRRRPNRRSNRLPPPNAQPAQDVIEVDAAKQVLGREASDTGAASHIVFGPLLRVAQDRVGLRDLFEFLGGGRILVAVRMVFQRQLTECVLDRLVIGVAWNAEDLIEIVLTAKARDHFLRLGASRVAILRIDHARTGRRPGGTGLGFRLWRLGIERLSGLLQHSLQHVGLLLGCGGVTLRDRLSRFPQRSLHPAAQVGRQLRTELGERALGLVAD